MQTKSISEQLEGIVSAEDFAASSAELTEAWSSGDVGIESVDPILRFMEEHPDLDYGMPGPLVHFMEEFYLKGYEERLIESIGRRPTILTVWMLNRLLNGTEASAKRQALLQAMRRAAINPKTDQDTRDSIQHFLERLKA